jgi:IS30 family transposase
MSYHHLTIEERYQINAYKAVGYKNYEIAKEINVHPSTISRELKRNRSKITGTYIPQWAENFAKSRSVIQSENANKKMDEKMKNLIREYIKKDWSPEQASAMLKIKDNMTISFVRIYQFIEQDRLEGGDLHTHLRFYHTGHRRAKYGAKYKGKIEGRVSISKRPDIVDEMTRIGDFEIDTIIGSNRKGAISTAVDRGSKLVKISIPTTKKADEVEKEIKRILSPFKDKIETITSDNGFEFSNHKNIANSLDCDYYFCHPYSSWERGLNEYTNGLIRQYIPKGASFKNITAEYIQEIEDKLNNRPRKSLNWRTPNEVFYGRKEVA